MPFSNPLISSGGQLIRKSIQSPNYVPGVSGWAIKQDGSAEFQNVTLPASGSVSIGSLTSGTLNAAATLGSGSVQASNAGGSVTLDAAGLRLYKGVGTNTVKLDATTGNATFTGTVSGSSITGSVISGTTVIGGLIETASSGARVTLDAGSAGQISVYDSAGNQGLITKTFGGPISLSSGVQAPLASFSQTATNTIIPQSGGTISVSNTLATTALSASSTFTGTGGGTWNGGTTTIGANGLTTNLLSSTINLGNITGTSASTSLTMVGRNLFYVLSTAKAKTDVRDTTIRPEDVLAMRPVTYIDRAQAEEAGSLEGLKRHLGMIAEEVDNLPSIGPLLVVRDDDGEPMSLIYERIPVLHQIVLQHQAAELEQLRARVDALERLASAGR